MNASRLVGLQGGTGAEPGVCGGEPPSVDGGARPQPDFAAAD
ncbi:MAG: hypothetical protein Q7S40_13390 [Opitutaceae bacterium]|nr:hypothetical protein [Opitutaceae bacterium]